MKSLYLACLTIVAMIVVTFAWIKGSAPHLDFCAQHWSNSVWLARWSVHFIYLFPFWSSCYSSGCVSFVIMLIGLVRIIQLDSQSDALWFPVQKMRVLKMSRCLNWFRCWGITAHFLTNEWMAWKANVWLNNLRHKATWTSKLNSFKV